MKPSNSSHRGDDYANVGLTETGIALILLELLKEESAEAIVERSGFDGTINGPACGRILRQVLHRFGREDEALVEAVIKKIERSNIFSWNEVNAIWDFRPLPSWHSWWIIHEIIVFAQEHSELRSVAARIVGAALDLHFPAIIPSFSKYDDPVAESTRFEINGTHFWVTDRSTFNFVEKLSTDCTDKNMYLLVPSCSFARAQIHCEIAETRSLIPRDIESFASQFLDTAANFSATGLQKSLRQFLGHFNRPVSDCQSELRIALAGRL